VRRKLTQIRLTRPFHGLSNASSGAFIDPTRTPGVFYDRDADRQGIPQANMAEEFAHEVLGHIWGALFGGHDIGRANMRDAIGAENAVRKLDPTRGQKAIDSHHNYYEQPKDRP
jgi:hypothetical protein